VNAFNYSLFAFSCSLLDDDIGIIFRHF